MRLEQYSNITKSNRHHGESKVVWIIEASIDEIIINNDRIIIVSEWSTIVDNFGNNKQYDTAVASLNFRYHSTHDFDAMMLILCSYLFFALSWFDFTIVGSKVCTLFFILRDQLAIPGTNAKAVKTFILTLFLESDCWRFFRHEKRYTSKN